MSEWHRIKDPDDVALSSDGTTLDVLFDYKGFQEQFGNVYIEIPVEFIKDALKAYIEGVRAEAIGWAHADACIALDNGFDPRQTEVPEMLYRAQIDLKGK